MLGFVGYVSRSDVVKELVVSLVFEGECAYHTSFAATSPGWCSREGLQQAAPGTSAGAMLAGNAAAQRLGWESKSPGHAR